MTEESGRAIRRLRAAAVGLVVLGMLLALLPRPPADNSVDVWLPTNSKRMAEYESFRAAFRATEVVVVTIEGGTPTQRLDFVGSATGQLQGVAEVEQVVSATTAYPREREELASRHLAGPLNRTLQLANLDAGRATLYAMVPPGANLAPVPTRA